MLIPFDDPIWSRLYGPYGVQDVPGALRSLSNAWDDKLAKDLFWEKLHHQDTLYPVTYAALPWLKRISDQTDGPLLEYHLFQSHMLYCATAPWYNDANARYGGLSLDHTRHAHSYLTEHLTQPDMTVLERLGDWLALHEHELATGCLAAVPGTSDFEAAMLCQAFCAVHDGHGAGNLISFWADGHSEDFVWAEAQYDTRDLEVLQALYTTLEGQAIALRSFITLVLARGVQRGQR